MCFPCPGQVVNERLLRTLQPGFRRDYDFSERRKISIFKGFAVEIRIASDCKRELYVLVPEQGTDVIELSPLWFGTQVHLAKRRQVSVVIVNQSNTLIKRLVSVKEMRVVLYELIDWSKRIGVAFMERRASPSVNYRRSMVSAKRISTANPKFHLIRVLVPSSFQLLVVID